MAHSTTNFSRHLLGRVYDLHEGTATWEFVEALKWTIRPHKAIATIDKLSLQKAIVDDKRRVGCKESS